MSQEYDLSRFMVPENLVRSNFYSDTYRAEFTVGGERREWDITRILVPFPPDKEEAALRRFNIRPEDKMHFYGKVLQCIKNDISVSQYIFNALDEGAEQEAVSLRRSCVQYLYTKPQRRENSITREIVRVSKPYKTLQDAGFIKPDGTIPMDKLLEIQIRTLQVIRQLNLIGVHLGAIDLDALLVAEDSDPDRPTLALGSFMYAGTDSTPRIQSYPACVPKNIFPALLENKDLAPTYDTDLFSWSVLSCALMSGGHWDVMPDLSVYPAYMPQDLLIPTWDGFSFEADKNLQGINKEYNRYWRTVRKQPELNISVPIQTQPVLSRTEEMKTEVAETDAACCAGESQNPIEPSEPTCAEPAPEPSVPDAAPAEEATQDEPTPSTQEADSTTSDLAPGDTEDPVEAAEDTQAADSTTVEEQPQHPAAQESCAPESEAEDTAAAEVPADVKEGTDADASQEQPTAEGFAFYAVSLEDEEPLKPDEPVEVEQAEEVQAPEEAEEPEEAKGPATDAPPASPQTDVEEADAPCSSFYSVSLDDETAQDADETMQDTDEAPEASGAEEEKAVGTVDPVSLVEEASKELALPTESAPAEENSVVDEPVTQESENCGSVAERDECVDSLDAHKDVTDAEEDRDFEPTETALKEPETAPFALDEATVAAARTISAQHLPIMVLCPEGNTEEFAAQVLEALGMGYTSVGSGPMRTFFYTGVTQQAEETPVCNDTETPQECFEAPSAAENNSERGDAGTGEDKADEEPGGAESTPSAADEPTECETVPDDSDVEPQDAAPTAPVEVEQDSPIGNDTDTEPSQEPSESVSRVETSACCGEAENAAGTPEEPGTGTEDEAPASDAPREHLMSELNHSEEHNPKPPEPVLPADDKDTRDRNDSDDPVPASSEEDNPDAPAEPKEEAAEETQPESTEVNGRDPFAFVAPGTGDIEIPDFAETPEEETSAAEVEAVKDPFAYIDEDSFFCFTQVELQ